MLATTQCQKPLRGRGVGVVDGDGEAAGALGEARPGQLRRAVLAAGAHHAADVRHRQRRAVGAGRCWSPRTTGTGRQEVVGAGRQRAGRPCRSSRRRGAGGRAAVRRVLVATLGSGGAAPRVGARPPRRRTVRNRRAGSVAAVLWIRPGTARVRPRLPLRPRRRADPHRDRAHGRVEADLRRVPARRDPGAAGVHPGRLQPLRRRQAAGRRRPRLPGQPRHHPPRGRRPTTRPDAATVQAIAAAEERAGAARAGGARRRGLPRIGPLPRAR